MGNAHALGLDRPHNLSFGEQFALYLQYPSVSIPVTLGFFGGLILILSVALAMIGVIQRFL
jgi:hypothetical protein